MKKSPMTQEQASEALQKHFGNVSKGKEESESEEEEEVKPKEVKKEVKEEPVDDGKFNFPILPPTGKNMSSQTAKLNIPRKDWVYNKPEIKKRVDKAEELDAWYKKNKSKLPKVPFEAPLWWQWTTGRSKVKEDYSPIIVELMEHDQKLYGLLNPDQGGGGFSKFMVRERKNFDDSNTVKKYDVDEILSYLKEYIVRGKKLM